MQVSRLTACPAHLDGVHQVLHEEQAPDFCDGLVEFSQNHVAVLVDHVLGQGHLLVEVLPKRRTLNSDSDRLGMDNQVNMGNI